MKKLLAVLAAVAMPTAVSAQTQRDVNELIELIAGADTRVEFKSCGRRSHGYFRMLDGETLIAICTEETPLSNTALVWETVSHEATHLMQWCFGGNIVKDEHLEDIISETTEANPSFPRIIMMYPESDRRSETEAFWMETKSPEFVKYNLKRYCYPEKPFPIWR